jgi:hypothetical protein
MLKKAVGMKSAQARRGSNDGQHNTHSLGLDRRCASPRAAPRRVAAARPTRARRAHVPSLRRAARLSRRGATALRQAACARAARRITSVPTTRAGAQINTTACAARRLCPRCFAGRASRWRCASWRSARTSCSRRRWCAQKNGCGRARKNAHEWRHRCTGHTRTHTSSLAHAAYSLSLSPSPRQGGRERAEQPGVRAFLERLQSTQARAIRFLLSRE